MDAIQLALRDGPADVEATLFGSLYATLREPDSMHKVLPFDVDRTVAYGLHTTLRSTFTGPYCIHTTLHLDADRIVS